MTNEAGNYYKLSVDKDMEGESSVSFSRRSVHGDSYLVGDITV
jgi:hypothetical protein